MCVLGYGVAFGLVLGMIVGAQIGRNREVITVFDAAREVLPREHFVRLMRRLGRG